jgi:N-dimethylarginine dimethylaminohydrolase
MAILMCRPDHYGVEYEINPWMHLGTVVDARMALAQWQALQQAYRTLGETVELVDQQPGLPDMVFAANAAVARGREAVLSRFRHPERQGEEPLWQAALERLGMRVHTVPPDVVFEGAGDALFVGERLFCGHGFRTDRESHPLVSRALDVEVVSLRLVDPRFYHLDTCFCPLNDRTVLFAPDAFDPASQQLVRRIVPHVIEVPVEVAAGFACNAVSVGDRVISSLAAGRLQEPLHDAGFATLALPMSEFIKSGGGVRCLSLPLDLAA